MTLPTSTTNITGLRATSRGSSLRNELAIAGQISPFIEASLRIVTRSCCTGASCGSSGTAGSCGSSAIDHPKSLPAYMR